MRSPEQEAAFLGLLRAGDGVIDIGANAGEYARAYAQAVGPTGYVLAVEPDPDVAQWCRQQCAAFPQIHVLPVAVGDTPDTVAVFHRDSGDTRRSSIWEANIVQRGPVFPVAVMTLDALAAHVPRLRGVKVDAQGAEVRILRGASRTLARTDVAWFIEFWPYGLATAGDSVQDLRATCDAAGLCPTGGWEVLAGIEPHIPHANRDLCLVHG